MNSIVKTDTVIGTEAKTSRAKEKVSKVDENEDLFMKAFVLVVIVAATLSVTPDMTMSNASSKSAVRVQDQPVLELFVTLPRCVIG